MKWKLCTLCSRIGVSSYHCCVRIKKNHNLSSENLIKVSFKALGSGHNVIYFKISIGVWKWLFVARWWCMVCRGLIIVYELYVGTWHVPVMLLWNACNMYGVLVVGDGVVYSLRWILLYKTIFVAYHLWIVQHGVWTMVLLMSLNIIMEIRCK